MAVSQAQNGYLEGQACRPENGQISKRRKKKWLFPKHRMDIFEGQVYWPENGQINKKKKWMFSKHRMDISKGWPENGPVSKKMEEEEVDVSQVQDGYILKDEVYRPVPSSCRAEALCCGRGQAGGADGGGCACSGRWYCAAFGPNLHKQCATCQWQAFCVYIYIHSRLSGATALKENNYFLYLGVNTSKGNNYMTYCHQFSIQSRYPSSVHLVCSRLVIIVSGHSLTLTSSASFACAIVSSDVSKWTAALHQ